MKNRNWIVVALLLASGCGSKEIPACLLTEVVVSYPGVGGNGAQETEKYVYYHNGANYSQIDIYYNGGGGAPFPSEPTFVLKLTYESDRIAEVLTTYPYNQGFYERYLYSYTDREVTKRILYSTNGTVDVDTSYTWTLILEPEDSTYLIHGSDGNPSLATYKDGNLISLGFPAPNGSYHAYDTTWYFPVTYFFDDKPNAAKDYAFQRIFGFDNAVFQTSENNMIRQEVHAGDSVNITNKYNLTYLHDRYIKTYSIATGRLMTFKYDCE